MWFGAVEHQALTTLAFALRVRVYLLLRIQRASAFAVTLAPTDYPLTAKTNRSEHWTHTFILHLAFSSPTHLSDPLTQTSIKNCNVMITLKPKLNINGRECGTDKRNKRNKVIRCFSILWKLKNVSLEQDETARLKWTRTEPKSRGTESKNGLHCM